MEEKEELFEAVCDAADRAVVFLMGKARRDPEEQLIVRELDNALSALSEYKNRRI